MVNNILLSLIQLPFAYSIAKSQGSQLQQAMYTSSYLTYLGAFFEHLHSLTQLRSRKAVRTAIYTAFFYPTSFDTTSIPHAIHQRHSFDTCYFIILLLFALCSLPIDLCLAITSLHIFSSFTLRHLAVSTTFVSARHINSSNPEDLNKRITGPSRK